MSANVLYTMNFGDNLHGCAKRINQLGWADYVVQIEYTGGFNSVIVFRLPADVLKQAQEAKRVW